MRVGILGGGQLAQMLTQAAISLGIETAIYDTSADTPASRLTAYKQVGAWDDADALRAFAAECDVLTLENEFVLAEPLRELEQSGVTIFPRPSTLATVQDKYLQKLTMRAANVPVPYFMAVNTPEEAARAGEAFGYPFLLKARYGGYDGYGNATVPTPEDLDAAWVKLSRPGRDLMAEAFVPFERELAVMVVRDREGTIRTYPVVETVQQNHICHIVRAPALIPDEVADQVDLLARRAVEGLKGIGVFGVEMFMLADGRILYNETAPRPHNSGHYSIEACATSQFENHLRAVLGLPLGNTTLRSPAVMINLLGLRDGQADALGIREALEIGGAHLHIYGKREVRVGRKMGHITALGKSVAAAEIIARSAADRVQL
jgi:5-(carboxyamino)imidazole ribonucleotide synthase